MSAWSQSLPTGSHLGEIQVEVVPAEQRSISVAEFTRRWREASGMIPGAVELSFTSTMISAGAAIHLEMSGPDLDELASAAERAA